MVQMMEIDAQVGEEGGPNDKAQRKQYLMMSFKVMEILVQIHKPGSLGGLILATSPFNKYMLSNGE